MSSTENQRGAAKPDRAKQSDSQRRQPGGAPPAPSKTEAEIDEGLMESFPASDPPSSHRHEPLPDGRRSQ